MFGSVRAARTFRLRSDGALLPVTTRSTPAGSRRNPGGVRPGARAGEPWVDGVNVAVCARGRGHRAAEGSCSCGFYGYGSLEALRTSGYAGRQHVVAVMACEGRVVPATRGLRAERARVEAVWLSPACDAELVEAVAARYPSTAVYRSVPAMLGEHPLSRLLSYRLPRVDRPWVAWPRFAVALAYWVALAVFLRAVVGPAPKGGTPSGHKVALSTGAAAGSLLFVAVLAAVTWVLMRADRWWPVGMALPPLLAAGSWLALSAGAPVAAAALLAGDVMVCAPVCACLAGIALLQRVQWPLSWLLVPAPGQVEARPWPFRGPKRHRPAA